MQTGKLRQLIDIINNSRSNKTPKTARHYGSQAEEVARHFLQQNQLVFIAKNYHCRQGEIDLIMQDQDIWVFIEVRYRKTLSHGTPQETINQYKLKRIRTAINHYTMTNNLGYIPCRIDMVGLHGDLQQPKIHWIKNILID